MKDHPSQSVHVRTESVNRFSRCMRQKQLQPLRRRDWNRRKKSRKEKKTVLREIVITATKEEITVDVMTEEMTDAITVVRADVMTDAITVIRADVMTDAITVIRADAMTDAITATIVIRADAMTDVIIVDVMTEEMTDVTIVIRADVMTDVIIVDVMTDVTTARTVRQFQSQSWKVRSHRETKEKVRMTLRRKIKTSAMTKTA